MSNARSLVSVIIPAYNASRWIERTLASVCAQTYTRLEIIVVDDGSTDDTAQRVERAALDDARIRLCRQANAGPAAARNHAIAKSNGAYIAPIDADDLWAQDNVALQVEALEANPAATFSFARSLWLDEHDVVVAPPHKDPPPPCTYANLLTDNFIGNGSACLMRRAHVDAVGGYDQRFTAGGEDWLLTLRLAARGPFVCVPHVLIGYRQSPFTFSAAGVKGMCRSLLAVIDEMQRSGPSLPAHIYARARTRGLIWYLPRLRRTGDWAALMHYGAQAFLSHAHWLEDRYARDYLLRTLLRRKSNQPSPSRPTPFFDAAFKASRQAVSDAAHEGAA